VVVVAFLRATWRRIAYTQRKGIVTHLFMHYNTPTHSVDCTGCVRDALARFPRGCARFLDRFKAVLSRSQTRGQHACCPVRPARDTRARLSHAEGRGPVGVAASPRCGEVGQSAHKERRTAKFSSDSGRETVLENPLQAAAGRRQSLVLESTEEVDFCLRALCL
jgi:hypothetical protein